MEQNTFDAIVIGAGAMGSMAAWQLSKRGLKTAAIEQFQVGHDRGSSHGETRIIRQAYFEHSDYVPLLRSAYRVWEELEQACKQTLFVRTGLLIAGDPTTSGIVQGIDRSAERFGLAVDKLTEAQCFKRFPQFRLRPKWEARYEPNAGYLKVESAVKAGVWAARESGCEVIETSSVQSWQYDGHRFLVEAGGRRLNSKHLVICAGAWTAKLLPAENLPLTPRRITVHWYGEANDQFAESKSTPCFGFDTESGFLYGFPSAAGRLVKAGLHVPGEVIENPDAMRRAVDGDEHVLTTKHLREFLPGISDVPSRSQVCIYTMTPDEHFIIDRSHQNPQLVYACGFSGHGFKFAALVGEVLADLVTEGRTKHSIEFLRRERF